MKQLIVHAIIRSRGYSQCIGSQLSGSLVRPKTNTLNFLILRTQDGLVHHLNSVYKLNEKEFQGLDFGGQISELGRHKLAFTSTDALHEGSFEHSKFLGCGTPFQVLGLLLFALGACRHDGLRWGQVRGGLQN
jgi:hypothetical protein